MVLQIVGPVQHRRPYQRGHIGLQQARCSQVGKRDGLGLRLHHQHGVQQVLDNGLPGDVRHGCTTFCVGALPGALEEVAIPRPGYQHLQHGAGQLVRPQAALHRHIRHL
jgi:hypothetical protein